MKIIRSTDNVIDLQSLVYVSTAAHFFSPAEIDHLLERAQARNTQEAVTGVLFYNDGSILQYLEGPSSGLTNIYEIIKADPLHYGVIELLHETISTREFPNCPMAFHSTKLVKPREVNEHLSQWLNVSDGPISVARMVITRLWNRGRWPG